MGKRTKYTEQERAERDAADAQLREQARELLTHHAAVAAMVDQLVSVSRSPKVLRYSLRNQALLTKQATERDMILTDVDSFRGWLERGRCVRKGERGLRIVAPKGTDGDPNEETGDQGTHGDHDQPAADPTSEDTNGPRVRFRMVPVFDIAQTDGVEDAEVSDAATADDPAAVLRATLTEQIERLGYTITETTQQRGSAEVDEQAATVTVSAGTPVGEFARVLAILVTRPKGNRKHARNPTATADTAPVVLAGTSAEPLDTSAPCYMQRVRLALDGGYGAADVKVWTEWTTGRTYYKIRAPRVSGVWTISVDNAADTDTVTAINVDYGLDDGRTYYNGYRPRPQSPDINGVPITGATHGIRPDSVDDLTQWRINASRPTGPVTSQLAPERTRDRMAAVVRAILRHWLARPDLDEVHRACARHEAPHRMQEAARHAHQLSEQIQALTAERDQHATQADTYRQVAEDTTQLTLFAGTTA